MSKTAKDRPWWVKAELWEPYHRDCPNDVPRSRWYPPRGPGRECDLPAEPVVQHPYWFGRRCREVGCIWIPDDTGVYPFRSVPKRFRDHRWTNPQRRAVRDVARRAAAEYRAHGQVDVEMPEGRGRHSARWDWE